MNCSDVRRGSACAVGALLLIALAGCSPAGPAQAGSSSSGTGVTADDPGGPATGLAEPTTPAAQPASSPPRVYQGRGDDVVSIEKDPGLAIVRFECLRCTGNTVVKTDGQE